MKRKETKKDIPPDLKAVQLLLSGSEKDFSKMSDEELERERDRLLAELESKKSNGDELKKSAESKTASNVKKAKSGEGKRKKGAEKSTAKKNKGIKGE